VTALCNQPEAFALDLGDDQSRYLLAIRTAKYVSFDGIVELCVKIMQVGCLTLRTD